MKPLEFGTPLLQLPEVPQSVLVDPLQMEVWPSSDPAPAKNIAAIEKTRTALRCGAHNPFAEAKLDEANDKRRTGL
jgi:hypothetical protein